MQAIYSPSSQTLSLIPRSSPSPPYGIPCTQSEFLGRAHDLANSKLRHRRRSSHKQTTSLSGSGCPPPTLRIVASLNSGQILVVVVAVAAAVSGVYLNYHSKRKKHAEKVSARQTAERFEKQRESVSAVHDLGGQDLPIDALHVENVKEAKNVTRELRESVFQRDDDDDTGDIRLYGLESASAHGDTHTIESLDLLSLLHNEQNPIASWHQQGDEEVCLPLQMQFPEPDALQSVASVTQVSKLESDQRPQEVTDSGSTLPSYQEEIGESSSGSVTDVHGEEHNLKKLNDHIDHETNGSSASAIESSKEELPLFHVEDQSPSTFPKILHEVPELCPQGSYPGGHHVSASAHSSTAELLQEDRHFVASGYSEQIGSLSAYRITGSRRKKESGQRKATETCDRVGLLTYEDNSVALPQRKNVQGKQSSAQKLDSYHRLIRYGRLNECIELLEEMDKDNALDMNKVYHSRFLSLCRSRKAVSEAFRFVNLIPNPTLSTFNMLMSVCSSAQDSDGAAKVWQLVQEAGFKADCKLYTTMISTYGKSGKVDAIFKVFHEMVTSGVEPNLHTYGALIDGCARAGQVAKAFGAYGILRSKKVKPDRVIFNALITACGQSGAVDRAFDVLEEMRAEPNPILPDHVTVGALMKACTNAGRLDRVQEVYKMVQHYNIKGTAELYTIAVHSCSHTGDWTFACDIYSDMRRNGVVPDEMFLSTLIDVAGHAGDVDAAFEVLQVAKLEGMDTGIMPYSSLMGACCSNKNWGKALELYEEIKAMRLVPAVTTMNALITTLCEGNQLQKALEALLDMRRMELSPNDITYSVLFVASEKNDNLDVGLMLFSQIKEDSVPFNLVMCKCLIGMCSRRFQRAATLGELSVSFKSGKPQLENEWTSLAVMIYREAIEADLVLPVDVLSQVLGCLHLPPDLPFRERLIELLGVDIEASRSAKYFSLIDGFGEYDLRAFSLLEEAVSSGLLPSVSFKGNPIVIDARNWPIHVAEVYLLTVLKGLKHRLAAGAKLPTLSMMLPVEVKKILSPKGEETINVAGRAGQAIGALLRRRGLPYQGDESYGKIRINGRAVRRWFQPKTVQPFNGKPAEFGLSAPQLGKQIAHQQRDIRTENYSYS